MGRTGHSPGDWRHVLAAFCLFFRTYLWPFGGGGERQRVGLGGSLGRAGVCAAEGCLDHVNGLGVAHLSQGLHQLLYGAPRDLRNEGRVCFCVPACAGNKQAANSTPHPVPCQAAASTEAARAHGRSGGEPLKKITEPPHRL